MSHTADSLREQFSQCFGGDPDVIVRAPGRVNLIGEHTDYSDGFVMPAAIDRSTWVAARRTGGASQLASRERGVAPVFDAASAEPGQVEGWAQYPAGVAWSLRFEGFDSVSNVEAVVASELPSGAGLSSSAALEVAFLHVWNELGGYRLTGLEIARLARLAENRFVGVGCGIMDPLASALGRAGHALLVDTRTLEVAYAPIPSEWRLVVCDTAMPRALADSAYNQRRLEVERAAQLLGVAALRDADSGAVDDARGTLGELLHRRARHVVSENQRVQTFAAALQAADEQGVGRTMRASHVSLRDDFEVSCPELDSMAEAAWSVEGCVGARMTGAGFGGACVALVRAEAEHEFVRAVARAYGEQTGRVGTFQVVSASNGAGKFM